MNNVSHTPDNPRVLRSIDHATTAPERFELLLPWLNGDALPHGDVVVRVVRFIAESGLIGPRPSANAFSETALVGLRRRLLKMLTGTVPGRGERQRQPFETTWALPSLRFEVVRNGGASAKLSVLTAAERRAHLGPSRYQMVVLGELRDVLIYAVMRTLTEAGAVALARCPAPAPHDWSARCDRWFIVTGQRRGRPADYCSTNCRVRNFKKAAAENSRRSVSAGGTK